MDDEMVAAVRRLAVRHPFSTEQFLTAAGAVEARRAKWQLPPLSAASMTRLLDTSAKSASFSGFPLSAAVHGIDLKWRLIEVDSLGEEGREHGV
jgi:hypothetical protein